MFEVYNKDGELVKVYGIVREEEKSITGYKFYTKFLISKDGYWVWDYATNYTPK